MSHLTSTPHRSASDTGLPRFDASIEVTVRQAIESHELPDLFPAGVRVYIPDMGDDDLDTFVHAARRIRDAGYRPVPHFAARRLPGRSALENRLAAMSSEAGVNDVLVIGGGAQKPLGEFSSSLQMLETELFDKYNITEIGVAGHPEGSPDFNETDAVEALRLKGDFAQRTGARMRIVTQFGFDGPRFANWADELAGQGIGLPVHIGVAGPAKLPTLIRYATICGVGNSLSFLRKRGRAIATLVSGFSPEEVVVPIEDHVGARSSSPIQQLHVFPFGGLEAAAAWLTARGSWLSNTRQPS